MYKNLKMLGGPQEERNSPKSIHITGGIWLALAMDFPAWRGLLKVRPEIPYEKFQHSQFKRAYLVN